MMRSWIVLTLCFTLFMMPSTTGAQDETVSQVPAPSFRVGPGDEIEIMVWKDDYLTRAVTVQPDGFFSFPLIGDVSISSLTIPQIREEITRRIREYLPDAQVSVIIKQINSYRIYVIGKVNKSGEYKVSHPVTVMQALAMAESFDKFASPDDIRIIRKVGGKHKAIPFNYNEVEKGKNLDQNVELLSGDVVVVP